MSVDRFDCTNGGSAHCYGCYKMDPSEYGDYVRHEDYESLRAENERLKKDAERAKKISNAWRNRLASELTQQGEDGYEMRRARAEARANEFEDAIESAIDAAMNGGEG